MAVMYDFDKNLVTAVLSGFQNDWRAHALRHVGSIPERHTYGPGQCPLHTECAACVVSGGSPQEEPQMISAAAPLCHHPLQEEAHLRLTVLGPAPSEQNLVSCPLQTSLNSPAHP